MKYYFIFLFFLVLNQNIFSQNVNEPTVILDTVTVTSSRYEKNINQLTYSASVVDLGKINKSTSQSISELLKTETGINLIRDGIWGTEVSIRGMNRSNIVTLIDGNRIETSTDISARLSMIDLNDIDKIEVIKGAASTLYGTGATGGIVNIISKKGNYENHFLVRGGFNSGFNSVNNNFLNGITLSAASQKWVVKLSGSYRKADNMKTPSGTIRNSQFEDNSVSSTLSFKPFENQEAIINYQQYNAFDVGLPGGSSLFPNNATVSYPEERRKLFSAEYKITNVSPLFRKVTAKFYNQYIFRDVENIPYQIQMIPGVNGQSAKRISVIEIRPSAKHFTNGFQIQSDFLLGNNQYLISGFDYWKRSYTGVRTKSQKIEILDSTQHTAVKTSYKDIVEKPLPDANYSSAGLYIQDDIRLIERKLNLTVGGRFDLINLKNDETKNPLYERNNGIVNNTPPNQNIIWKSCTAKNTSYTYNVGILYSVSEFTSISFNAARSFRSASLEERYQYIDQGNVIRIGDPQLKPEKGYYLDCGFRINRSGYKIKTSIFYNFLNDLVTEQAGIFEGRNAFIKVNIGKANLYGFELEGNYNIGNSWMIYNSLSFVRGRNLKAQNDLPQIPPLNGILGIKYSLLKSMEADFSALFFADQNKIAPGEISTPGYVIFNMNLSFAAINFGQVSFNFYTGIENILNKAYRNHLSTNRGYITIEPGRNIYVKTNISW